jgi:hypothetical protein
MQCFNEYINLILLKIMKKNVIKWHVKELNKEIKLKNNVDE